ncbi:hypothetical protein [Fusobacterium sp.]|uniref:hypothetical protein n=1 Tax=Fusobacterium sp. TaxID=68766 RepID=UPI00260E452E|nr:hypothetical protein [Fusobacterium sp.]
MKLKKFLIIFSLSFSILGCNNSKMNILNYQNLVETKNIHNNKFIFDSARIKKVFCEWELIEEGIKDNNYLRFYNKKKDIIIDFVKYGKKDTPKKAFYNLYKSALKNEYRKSYIDNLEAEKLFSQFPEEYYLNDGIDIFKREDLIFSNLYVSFTITNGENKDITDTFKLIKEAIDPNESIKQRKPLENLTYYKLENIFDIDILESEIKKYSGNYTKFTVGDKNTKVSTFAYDYSFYNHRKSISIINNNNFSKELIHKKIDRRLRHIPSGNNRKTIYKGEDKKSIKYFGIPSKKYEKRGDGYRTFYTTYLIITDIYTIKIDMEESIFKNEKDIDKEYEELLKIVNKSLKLKQNNN